MKVCIVIPAYNEENTISRIVEEANKYTKDVIVVDDGSTDETRKLARQSGAKVLHHAVNLGVGSATITGNNYAVSKGFDIIVNLDSDGQHSGNAVPKGIDVLTEGGYDIVIGSRFLDTTKKMPVILKLGNRFLTLFNTKIFGSDISDTQSGFRIVTAQAWKILAPNSSGYSICSEIASLVGTKRLKYAEIPIKTIYLDSFKGTTIFDGIKIFANMLKWRSQK